MCDKLMIFFFVFSFFLKYFVLFNVYEKLRAKVEKMVGGAFNQGTNRVRPLKKKKKKKGKKIEKTQYTQQVSK